MRRYTKTTKSDCTRLRLGREKTGFSLYTTESSDLGRSLPSRQSYGSRKMKVFHAFRLDTVNHCLWRGEERMSVAPKAFDVLRYLVEHSERLVTQDEILQAIWPD